MSGATSCVGRERDESRTPNVMNVWTDRASSLTVVVSVLTLIGCSAPQGTDREVSPAAHLVNKVWSVSGATARPLGSFYIFLQDGTLVMTSCVETYRLATWRAETATRITIVEDPVVSYGAEIEDVSDQQIRLRLDLRSEKVQLTLKPTAAPYVCPDMPR